MFRVVFATALAASAANAGLIDFEGLTPGSVGTSILLADDGVDVTFSSTGTLVVRDFNNPPFPRSQVLHVSNFTDPIVVEFSTPVYSVSFQNYIFGFYTSEVDTIRMTAFDTDGNTLDDITSSAEFLAVSSAARDIIRVVIDDQGTGYQIDNIVFTVPAPAAGAPFLFACLAGRTRRRM